MFPELHAISYGLIVTWAMVHDPPIDRGFDDILIYQMIKSYFLISFETNLKNYCYFNITFIDNSKWKWLVCNYMFHLIKIAM